MAVTTPIDIPGMQINWIDGNLEYIDNARLTVAVK
jgi:hypothetical protein